LSVPENHIGLLCVAIEKYYDVSKGQVSAKRRPVLIIGYDNCETDPMRVDYEVLWISKLSNGPINDTYDFEISGEMQNRLKLDYKSYIRSHRISWINRRQLRIETPISNLKDLEPDLFKEIIDSNYKWVLTRNTVINDILESAMQSSATEQE
jgi:hypothetical protein